MNTLFKTISNEIEHKVRKSIVEQGIPLPSSEVDEIVEKRIQDFAKRLVQVFDLED